MRARATCLARCLIVSFPLSHALVNNTVVHGHVDDYASGGDFRAEEVTGLLTLRVRSGRYTVVAVIQVPDGYPIEGCGVELKSHNFPAHIARRHLVQVPTATACAVAEQRCHKAIKGVGATSVW